MHAPFSANRTCCITLTMLLIATSALAQPAERRRGRAAHQPDTAHQQHVAPDAPDADDAPRDRRDGDKKGDNEAEPWDADCSTTNHTVTIDGKELAYTATAGRMPMPDYEGEHRADIFFIAYTRDDAGEASQRPVTFTFNGGPGSSSVWLHLGALGPRRVEMGDEGEPLPPPGRVVPNSESWLDFTDLVFIDPVSTGYSRPAEGVDKSEFHGLEQDISSVGDFIRLWITRNERWASPKFLCGESYGTTRAAGLSSHLADRYGMYLSGITFVSAVLEFNTIRFGTGNDLPYILFLPTYTATAWYHNALEGDLARDRDAAIAAAEDFALGDYATALLAGDALPAGERARIVTRLSQLTGIDETFIDGVNLRISMGNFSKELLRDRKLTVGRFDSRYTGRDASTAGTRHEYDASDAAINGPFSEAINGYLRTGLGYESDHPYEVLTGRVHPWDYRTATNRYVNVAGRLRDAVTQNPAMQVLFAGGYYDLATPHFAMDYTIDHLSLAPEHRDNIARAYYGAGHMMYLRTEDRIKLRNDARAMYERAANATVPNPLGRN